MRTGVNIYHIQCFRCESCNRPLLPGDEYVLRDGQLLCTDHHEFNKLKSGSNNQQKETAEPFGKSTEFLDMLPNPSQHLNVYLQLNLYHTTRLNHCWILFCKLNQCWLFHYFNHISTLKGLLCVNKWKLCMLFWCKTPLYICLSQRVWNPQHPGGGQREPPAWGRFSVSPSSACYRPVTVPIPDPMPSWKSSLWKWRASVLGSFASGSRTSDAKIRKEVWWWDTHRSSLRAIWWVSRFLHSRPCSRTAWLGWKLGAALPCSGWSDLIHIMTRKFLIEFKSNFANSEWFKGDL